MGRKKMDERYKNSLLQRNALLTKNVLGDLVRRIRLEALGNFGFENLPNETVNWTYSHSWLIKISITGRKFFVVEECSEDCSM